MANANTGRKYNLATKTAAIFTGALMGGMALASCSTSPSNEPQVSPTPAATADAPNTKPSQQETDPAGQLEKCVGQKFTHETSTGLEIVDENDAQRARDCVEDAGIKVTAPGRLSGGYGFDAKDERITFFISNDWMDDEENFGILRASGWGK